VRSFAVFVTTVITELTPFDTNRPALVARQSLLVIRWTTFVKKQSSFIVCARTLVSRVSTLHAEGSFESKKQP
jgi:hypothetical protein